jgi:heterodisulfide reductase subunit B
MKFFRITALTFVFILAATGAWAAQGCLDCHQKTNPGIVADRTNQIVSSALNQGAEVIVVSCPLCAFNLDHRQKETVQKYPDFKHVPVLYFTQLMAIALGCSKESLKLDLHYIDPAPLLKAKGLT